MTFSSPDNSTIAFLIVRSSIMSPNPSIALEEKLEALEAENSELKKENAAIQEKATPVEKQAINTMVPA